ncbi:MAG TPA: PucR family transcriptional regulator ligand-binding domain-containing protein [Anaerovoracaceae bacterium]|nr:PucR family transcriptional regulator ligand-binding domain-containing protein [Anaerovoracaceae bacterium]
MFVNVEDIFSLEIARNFQLRAGRNGLSNPVSWLYICQENEISPWVQGREILILYGPGIRRDEDSLAGIVRECALKKLSAVIVLVGNFITEIPGKMIRTADELNIPLIEMPYTIPISQVTRAIAELIIRDRSRRRNIGNLLMDILNGYEIYPGNAKDEFISSGYRWGAYNFIFAIKIEDANFASQIEDILGNLVQSILRTNVYYIQGNRIIGLCESELPDNSQKYENKFRKVVSEFREKLGLDCTIGVGSCVGSITALRGSYIHAIWALKTESIRARREPVIFFSRISGIFKLLMEIQDFSVAESYSMSILKPLLDYDREHNSNLYDTLLRFMDTNCNSKKTAELMYVHRNTMNYRIKMISGLTGKDLGSAEDRYELMTALKCHQFSILHKDR